MRTTKTKNKNPRKNRTRPAIIKNEFIKTTYPVIADLSKEPVSLSEYMYGLLNQRKRTPNTYFVILYSCPREPGALRKLKERVTTYVIDSDSNLFQHWMETMCSGSQSYVEPNMMIGPFNNTVHPAKKTLQSIKDRLANTRGVAQRIVHLSAIAKEYNVMTYGGVPPLLTSSDMGQLYTFINSMHRDGIFETAPHSLDGTAP